MDENIPTQDCDMPDGWHLIKSVLLREFMTSSVFSHCVDCAGALFHARLLAESIKTETLYNEQNECASIKQ